uniref:Complement subcomponent C1r n=1 Tax=Rhinopithecus bieti TaxID=61621 RepID=A0A2K6JYN9_RHIBE
MAISWLLYLLASTLFHRPRDPILIPQKLFGEVTFPLFPKPYPNSFETTTVITVPTGYRVKLIFQHFDLEPSEGCFYDYVKISAHTKNLGRFCGQLGSPLGNPPGKKEFLSQGNKMLLTFHIDFSNEENGTIMFYKGFLAYYQAVGLMKPFTPQPQCQHLCHNYVGGYFCSCRPGYELQKDSSELYTEASGYISSLEYPRSYSADLCYNYSIRVERSLTLHLKFVEPFEIDDHQQVHCPYIQLPANIGEFCGSQRPSRPLTPSSKCCGSAVLQPDESGESRGWRLPSTHQSKAPWGPPSIGSLVQPQYQIRDCFIGYLQQGNQVLHSFTAVCQDDGTWHRAMPRCKSNQGLWAAPKSAFHYTTTMGVNTYKARIQYYCHESYYKMQTRAGSRESEQRVYTCTAQGIWKNEQKEGKIPRCLPGEWKPSGRQRIIGGQKAKMGNFPWQVHQHPQEHEAQSNASLDVFLGHTNVEELMKLANHPIRRVSIHPDYRQDESHNFEGDIALLELENSVTLGPNLLPICLPDNETFYDLGLMGYVSGFEVMEEKIAHDLRFVRLPVKRMDVFPQNMFCAGHPSLKQDALRDPNTDPRIPSSPFWSS